ncbi:MAG: hypothetical protein LBI80_03250, partial [Endomicrobium sp.]|nr:hypothetical protein [Endomicrobium sp.]
ALDFSGKYFFSTLSAKDVSLPENQSVSFENESISKIKIGAKIHLNGNEGLLSTYLGSGFEYEPTNKIKATISNQSVDTPELGGGRGLIEAGFNTSYKNVGIDLSVKYSDGKAGNSMSGLLKFSYKI